MLYNVTQIAGLGSSTVLVLVLVLDQKVLGTYK